MQTGRVDLDAMIKVSTIPADEPTFLLRAQDPDGAETARDWARRHLARVGDAGRANAESANAQADAMDGWEVKKVPDADHLSEDDRKQLEYRFGRRERREEPAAEATRGDQIKAFLQTPEAQEILGYMIFYTCPIAHHLAATGDAIPPKTELEQAFVLTKFLSLAVDHGPGWYPAFLAQLEMRKGLHQATAPEPQDGVSA